MRKATYPDRPAFHHPDFDYEHRIVTARLPQATVASIYVPNGGKDFPAKMRFLEAMDAYAAEFQASGLPLVMCGDLNVARTDMDVHPKERKPRAIGQLPEERALIERIISRGLVDVHRALEPDNAELFTWWAPWRNMKAAQHRLAARLRARRAVDRRARLVMRGAERGGHERPRTRRCRVRSVAFDRSRPTFRRSTTPPQAHRRSPGD